MTAINDTIATYMFACFEENGKQIAIENINAMRRCSYLHLLKAGHQGIEHVGTRTCANGTALMNGADLAISE